MADEKSPTKYRNGPKLTKVDGMNTEMDRNGYRIGQKWTEMDTEINRNELLRLGCSLF